MTTGYCRLSIIVSSTPVTVTICASSQFSGVKVSDSVTVASPVSLEVSKRTTSERGSAVRTILNVSVVPVSLTMTYVLFKVISNPATSSSRFVPITSSLSTSAKLGSDVASLISTSISN